MFKITKNREPRSLTEYRLLAGSTYGGANSNIKGDIRDSLLSEQGFLCTYCMERITANSMKIEHWACQFNHKNKQLDYKNLLGCCLGNEGNPRRLQTCDTRKGSSSIKYSPSKPSHRIKSKIDFRSDGEVFSNEGGFDQELKDVLNLNLPRFVSNRLAVIKSIQKVLHKNKNNLTRQYLVNQIATVSNRNEDDMLKPFFEVKVRYLQKKLARF